MVGNKFCMDEREIQIICQEYLSGTSPNYLAFTHYCSRPTVINYLKRNGIPIRAYSHYTRTNKRPVAMIMNDWNSGMTAETIASTYGFMNRGCVFSYVQRMRINGYKFKRRKAVNKRDKTGKFTREERG